MDNIRIPFVDLKAQISNMRQEIEGAIEKVLEEGQFVLGKALQVFEEEFARYCGTSYAIGVGSGLDALRFALSACGVKEGDKVFLPAHTFIATALAVSQVGAIPFLIDVDPTTGLLDVEELRRELKKGSEGKAIIAVHLYGQIACMEEINRLALDYRLIVIEDACQAHGATIGKKKSGSFGRAGCFSFYPSKNLGAFGDGGMVVTQDKRVADTILRLRNYGGIKKYHHDILGVNSRLDTLQAAILKTKLSHLDQWNERRRIIAAQYREGLADLSPNLIMMREQSGGLIVYHLFVIRTRYRDKLRAHLLRKGIETGIHYPVPIHLQPVYQWLNKKQGSFPHAERLAEEVLSLPLYPELADEAVMEVISEIQVFFKQEASN